MPEVHSYRLTFTLEVDILNAINPLDAAQKAGDTVRVFEQMGEIANMTVTKTA